MTHVDILDVFNDNLSKYMDNKLVSYNNVSYTYGEGAFIADKIAQKLIGVGVKSQEVIGFLVPRSELYMLSVLSILSVGAVYVPLDDSLPDERLKFMINDSKIKVIIGCDETFERVFGLGSDCNILNISDILDDEIGFLSSLPVVYGDLACILYTSGTSGVPKGVKVTRKSVLNLSQAYVDNYALTNEDVYGLFSTIGFDAALLATVVVLYSGACLSIVPNEFRLNVGALNNYFMEHGVTHTLITSQVGKLFMQSVDDTSLEVLLVGGEKLGEIDSPKDYLLVDAFGPTEACVYISSIKNFDKLDSSAVGRLTYNTKAYILDNEFRRVPFGAVGELYVSGYQIAKGYLNRDDETEKSFINNPFDDNEEYNVLYRTGDMVRFLPDESMAIVGRRDSQVKIRGNRVELTEVESIIREIKYIENVTVQTIKNGENNELVAYVVSGELDDNLVRDTIQEYVGDYKPDYMVPSYVIRLDNIPLTVNGKVDRRALPDVDLDSLLVEYVAPTNETERVIVDAFESVFNQKGIGLYDYFTRLGGDSISAIRVISLLEKNGISCSARYIKL